jgi:hypothetical protein
MYPYTNPIYNSSNIPITGSSVRLCSIRNKIRSVLLGNL